MALSSTQGRATWGGGGGMGGVTPPPQKKSKKGGPNLRGRGPGMLEQCKVVGTVEAPQSTHG